MIIYTQTIQRRAPRQRGRSLRGLGAMHRTDNGIEFVPGEKFGEKLYRARLGDATCAVINGARVCSNDPGTSPGTTTTPVCVTNPKGQALLGMTASAALKYAQTSNDPDISPSAAVTQSWMSSAVPFDNFNGIAVRRMCSGSTQTLAPVYTQPGAAILPSGAVVNPIITSSLPYPGALTSADLVALANQSNSSAFTTAPGGSLSLAGTSGGSDFLSGIPTWAKLAGGGVLALMAFKMVNKR